MYDLISEHSPQFVADQGFSFESHFRYGAQCILARPDAPMLYFPDSMPLEFVRDTIEAWNVKLKGYYPGTGYYAFSQEEEMANPGYHVLVLFADASFCDIFMGNVESEILPPHLGGLIRQHLGKKGLLP